MLYLKNNCFLLIFLLISFSDVSAGILKGTIKDENGESLPYATVYIAGTTIGTSSNAEGVYELTIPSGSHKIYCQYMGFQQSSFTVTLQENETVTHHFKLKEQTLRIKEHIVKASEDPALYIIRKVIARRKFHQQQIKTFETDIYLKGVLRTREIPTKVLGVKVEPGMVTGLDSAGKGILYLCEEEATYYTQDNQSKTVIHAVRESGNPNGLGVSSFPEVVRFYENNIHISEGIAPRGMISPVSDGALNYYRYKLEGDFEEAGNTIYKITVTPKRPYEPLFTGTLYIVDEKWNIHSLDVFATQKSNINFLDTLRIEQLYIPLAPDTWVIKQQNISLAVKIMGFDLIGGFVTVYNGQKINQRIADTFFNSKITSIYQADANQKDTSYWRASRPIPLQEDEVRDFIVKDSVRMIEEDPAYLDSLRRRGNRISISDVFLGGMSFRGKESKYFIRSNALLSGLMNYNTVEGIQLAPRVNVHYRVDTFRHIQGDMAVRYGFSNQHWNAIGKIAYLHQDKIWRRRSWKIGVEGGKYVFQFNPYNPIQPLYNTITTLFYRHNYLKIYERAGGKIFFERNYGNGLKWSASASLQQRSYLENTTDFSFAKGSTGGFTPNFPPELAWMPLEAHRAALLELSLSWQPGYTYIQYPGYKVPRPGNLPVFSLKYEKGVPGIMDSKTDFDKWEAGIQGDIKMKIAGVLNYHAYAGGFLNNRYVGIPDLNHIQGNQVIIAAPYLESFQTAPYYLYSNKEPLYGAAHVEWNLNGFITNKIPLLRQLSWYLVAGGNVYYVNENLYHAEAFAGIDNIGYKVFRLFRVDVVQSWNSLNKQATAIRIGLKIGSLNFGGDW